MAEVRVTPWCSCPLPHLPMGHFSLSEAKEEEEMVVTFQKMPASPLQSMEPWKWAEVVIETLPPLYLTYHRICTALQVLHLILILILLLKAQPLLQTVRPWQTSATTPLHLRPLQDPLARILKPKTGIFLPIICRILILINNSSNSNQITDLPMTRQYLFSVLCYPKKGQKKEEEEVKRVPVQTRKTKCYLEVRHLNLLHPTVQCTESFLHYYIFYFSKTANIISAIVISI